PARAPRARVRDGPGGAPRGLARRERRQPPLPAGRLPRARARELRAARQRALEPVSARRRRLSRALRPGGGLAGARRRGPRLLGLRQQRAVAEGNGAEPAAQVDLLAAVTAGVRVAQRIDGRSLDRRRCGKEGLIVWGIVPAAGAGTRIQPLAFSKELL